MRIVAIRERRISLSRYADDLQLNGPLDTSVVALVTDVVRSGVTVIGYGFSSFGRFAQSGLIRERFAPRLIEAKDGIATAPADNIDPLQAWTHMMRDEKPGGHGERCVAVGTLDMALWDAAAKIANQPLYVFLTQHVGRGIQNIRVPVYAGGGYYFPETDLTQLKEETRRHLDTGYTRVKIKIGALSLKQDLNRINAVLSLLPNRDHLSVDAMNCYSSAVALEAAAYLAPYKLRWFEDICDPLDFRTHSQVAATYEGALAAGESLFSTSDARNLFRYGGLRKEKDILGFDPVHCYGLSEYLRIVDLASSYGWPRTAFQPKGGHLFALHIAAALGLGGCEANHHNFQPFGGFAAGQIVENGSVFPPDALGIGLETRPRLHQLLRSLTD